VSQVPRERSDPRHYLNVAWRWKWLLAAIVVVIPAAVYLVSTRLSDTYEASTTLFVQGTAISSSSSANPVTVATSSPSDVAVLIRTPFVGELAAKKLHEPPKNGRALTGSVTAKLDQTTGSSSPNTAGFLTITAKSGDPQRAVDIANAFADAVVTKRTNSATNAINQTITSLSADLAAAQGAAAKQQIASQIQQLKAARSTEENSTEVVNPPVKPTVPVSPKPKRNAALGFILALLLAAGLVPLLDRLDRRIRRVDELEELVDVPLLAMIPEAGFPGKRPDSRVREAFQTLRAGLTSFNVDHALGSVMITSPAHGDGKTTVAANLAIALAQDGRDVIIVDGDMRRCQLASRLGVDASIGLDAVLLEGRRAQDALVDVEGVSGGRLRVLPAVTPPPNPSILLGSARMKAVLAELTEMADIVLIDAPPLLVVSDALPLLDEVSGTILIARLDYTARDALSKARQVISTAHGTILGVVATGSKAGGLYGYEEYVTADDQLPGDGLALQPESSNGYGAFRRLIRRSAKREQSGERS
jgi:polysaccharide biosynthesis transport protein